MTANTVNASPQRHPVVVSELARRQQDIQLRIADAITAFAGSMQFVYLHALFFAVWMIWFEKSPWPTLTLCVSLEAIFLSTFVMIGQNRQAVFSQAKANHDFTVAEVELKDNTEITRLIHDLTIEIHNHYLGRAQSATTSTSGSHENPETRGMEK
jgi:uncharacterized membrane protein